MSTAAQQLASRENSQKSTGPKTAAGKARSSGNAVTHGFNSKEFIVPDDEHDSFEELREGLLQAYDPRDGAALDLFNLLLHASWNLRRIHRAEVALCDGGADPLTDENRHKQLELLARYHVCHERAYHRTRKALIEHQTNQVNRCTGLPRMDAETFPAVADVHSIHKARRTAAKAFDVGDLPSVPKTQRLELELRRAADLSAEPNADRDAVIDEVIARIKATAPHPVPALLPDKSPAGGNPFARF